MTQFYDEHGNEVPHHILESGPIEYLWYESLKDSDRHARTHARVPEAPPHWHRCNFMRNGERCVKLSGHMGDHEEPS